ncbi:MAG TPA: isoamylase early set domain-containing protein [Gemmatimonadaceae bacterium]|nr:isoamylase early set domain-containing protein [Gemmatimonadaceae bacterium]
MVEHYDKGSDMDDAAFLNRVAASLRTVEHAHASFERRVMEKVRAEGPMLYPRTLTHDSWWRTARPFNVAPLTAMAIAASALIVVALSGVAIGARLSGKPAVQQTAVTAPSRDTVQLVRFVFVDSRAANVQLVGDFNEWTKGVTELRPSGAPGVWAVSVPLSAGRHEYAFIVDGKRWVIDPLAIKSSDDFGTESSVIRVGADTKSTT